MLKQIVVEIDLEDAKYGTKQTSGIADWGLICCFEITNNFTPEMHREHLWKDLMMAKPYCHCEKNPTSFGSTGSIVL